MATEPMKTLTFPNGQTYEVVDQKARDDIADLKKNGTNAQEIAALTTRVDDLETAKTELQKGIDEAKKLAGEAGGAADGLTFDETTGVLQLTSGGEPITGATVTIKLTDAYTKDEVDQLLAALRNTIAANTSNIETNTTNIAALGRSVETLQQTLNSLDTEGFTYYATYGTAVLANGEEAENVFTLYQVKGSTEEVVSQFVIQGGGGGGSTTTTNLTVDRITASPLIITPTDKVEIAFNYSSTDSDGEAIDGSYTWKLGSTVLATGACVQGVNTFDFTENVGIGTQRFTLTVVDAGGSTVVKTWTVQVVDVRIESTFSDRITYPAGNAVKFTYTPYGAVSKTVHVVLDGVELTPATVTSSGVLQSYTLPAQAHGAHLLECWITATVNNAEIETDHIFKDIVWFDEASDVPVIGCIYRYDHYGKVPAKQYDSTGIQMHVFDPNTAAPTIVKTVDGAVASTEVLTTSAHVWPYKTDVVGDHTLIVTCGVTQLKIIVAVEELGIEITPITAGLAFDFNPVGLSNNSANRLWTDADTGVAMTVSDNFDWTNGGYQIDADGNQYFCVKAGTRAVINHPLFKHNAALYGAEFKLIFRATNVRDVGATFLSCVTGDTAVGLRMDAHAAYLMTSATGDDPLYMPYSEEDIIEFEFNVHPLDQEDATATALIMSYEDGVGFRPLIYDASHRLYQYAAEAVPITIGSDDCDIHIYRMKAYTNALTDADILSNFIADARSAEVMLARYYRNQIYNENNALTPDSVAAACPDLKIIKIDAPYFTQDKGELVKGTIIECIHKGGDTALDNWRAVNCYHSGQGTTSNEYGYAGRNLNLYMCCDGTWTHKKITHDPDYKTELTLGDNTRYADGTGKVTLTRSSVPTNMFCIKVNIASSENANNALLQKRYNRYLPYTPGSVRRDANAKITMEFCNCVVFVRENSSDLTTHREFQDTDWHFYGIGNIGDGKDTDQSRATNPDDHHEFVVEISDNTLPNSIFPSGVVDDDGKQVYPIARSWWTAGNPAYDSLHNAWGDTYEFRYEHPDVTAEEQAANIAIWCEFYKWVVTSSDAAFVSELHNWCVPGAFEYMYLFTERYTMVDNRAKNTFWHWSKVYITQEEATALGDKAAWYLIDDAAAAINDGYRFDSWDYDNDTAIGINNSGEMTMTYGKEDVDYRTDGDASSGYIYNAAESIFFCRMRDLMHAQLQAMYLSRESAGAWSAEGLIAEFDAWQEQWPEELWRLDIERKYYRTYEGGTRRFLETMMNGRKRYHRRQWERDQEPYMGTKYVGAEVKADQIMFRCNTPQSAVVAPNYDLRIVPYTDMYISVMYGNSTPLQVRAKAGQEYEIKNPLSGAMDDTAVLIYCASRIQALNDLSGAYIHDNDFSKARKIQTLIIGNNTSGYSNAFLTNLNIGNNALLQMLNLRGCPNLIGSLNLTNCGNLETLYAEGTALTGVTFAPNGKIVHAYLPATVNTLVMRNLSYLTDLRMDYDSLESLTEEYTVVDELAIVQEAADTLQTLVLIGIDWTLTSTAVLNAILAMNSSTLSGKVHISGPIRQQEYLSYVNAWPDLAITYDTMVQQHKVQFLNWDGSVLHEQYVDRNGDAVDPVANGLIDTPARPSSISTVYTYDGWDNVLTAVLADRTINAVYSEAPRKYTVNWYGYQNALMGTKQVDYGAEAVYSGNVPTRTDEESLAVYYQFKDWDKSTGFVDQDIDVYPVWERGEMPSVGVDTTSLTPTQIYAIKREGRAAEYFAAKDRVLIEMGYQPDFTNVRHVDVATDMVMDGATHKDTGIKLLAGGIADPWVLVVDVEYTATIADATAVCCMKDDGYMGFKVKYNGGVSVQWSTNSYGTGSADNREIVVLRHEAGSRNLKVYASRLNEAAIGYTELTKLIDTVADATLVVGAAKSDAGEFYDYATGKLHSCRIWYGDLGETVCRKIAKWPREVYRAEAGTFGAYKLASNSAQKTQIDFIFASLLSRYHRMNPTGSNAGGFEASEMYTYLTTRVLPAFPEIWQRMMEECTINCMQYVDGTNHSIATMKAQIWLPSYIEMQGGTSEPWVYEGAEHIPFFINGTTRVKFKGPESFPRDGYNVFSAADDPTLDAANTIVDGDIWLDTNDSSRGYLRKDGKWLVAYYFWLRGASVTNAAYFCVVHNSGYVNTYGYGATNVVGVCPRFSI